MPGFGYAPPPTANARFAQLLAQSDPNNGTTAGGIGSLAQKLMMGLLLGRDQRDETQANEAFAQGMGAKPWINPDTGGPHHLVPSGEYDVPDPSRPDERMPIMNVSPTAKAGGMDGALQALHGMQGNPYAGRLSRDLMTKRAETDMALQAQAAEREAQLRNAMILRQSPQWEAPRKPVPGIDVPKPQAVFDQDIAVAGAKASAAQLPPSGYSPTPTGLQPTPGGPADPTIIGDQERARKTGQNDAAVAKPVPAAIMRLAMEQNEAVNTVEGIQANLSKYISQIDAGQLDLGMFTNWLSQGKNLVGASDEQSRNYASMLAGLEKLRNDSLRLNTGVQTDGDAQRAWKELIANLNDPQVVRQRLVEINELNMRAAAIKAENLDLLYSQYPALQKGPKHSAPESAPTAPPARTTRATDDDLLRKYGVIP